jgi:hypothetical protein
MASTYIAKSLTVPFASNQHMLTVFNPAASGKIVRVYRIWIENNIVSAVTGVTPILKVFRCTAASAGVVIVPVSYDSTNVALGTVAAGSKMTVTTSSLFGNRAISNEEPIQMQGGVEEWTNFIHTTELYNVGSRNSAIDPIVCREGQGITVQNSTATTVGNIDVFIEFTVT